MKNALFVITLLFFVSNCQSSRDKCYEFNTDDDWGDSCKSLVITYEPNANVEKNQKHLDLIGATCLLGEKQNKDCKKKRNWDIVDIF